MSLYSMQSECNFAYEEYFTQPKDEKQKQYMQDKINWRYGGNFLEPVFKHERENYQITGTQGVSEHHSRLSASTTKEKNKLLQSWAALQFLVILNSSWLCYTIIIFQFYWIN